MSPYPALQRLLGRQHGIVAVWQGVALGIHRATLVRFFTRHGFVSLGGGIYAAPWSTESFARRCAIERSRGSRARIVTAGAALTLLGVRKRVPSAVDLWTGPDRVPPRRPGVRLHRGAWRTGDHIVRVERIPCMPPLRMLRDAASTSNQARLVKDISGLDRLRLATPQQVVADLDRWGRFPGKPLLRAAAEECVGGLVHSEAEKQARSALAAVGVHVHPRPLAIYRRGHLLGEIDLPICSIRYGVEVDGPAHLEDGEPERDERRDRRLREFDWVIERFTTEQVEDGLGGFVEAVLEGIAAAAARGVTPWPCDRCPR